MLYPLKEEQLSETIPEMTQYNSNNSWNLNWNNGNLNNNNKNNNNYVRAVAEFQEKMEEKDYTIPLEDVLTAYYDCRRNKRRTMNALSFEVGYEEKCVELWRELNERTYEIGKSITFVVTKPKPREIFAADFRDRIVHHLIANRLEPLFERTFIEDTYNCRKGKGTLYGIRRLAYKVLTISNGYTEDCWIGKFDMKGFFMSIHKPTLNRMLQSFIDQEYEGKDKDLLKWIVEKVVMHCPEKNCIRKSPQKMWELIGEGKSLFKGGDDYGLAIGNLTSQMFANFYLHEFDSLIDARFEGYGRYVDDFYVISRDKREILSAIAGMKQWLKSNLGITLHPDKFYLQHYSKGVKFTGMVVKPARTYVGNATRASAVGKVRAFNRLAEREDYKAEHHVLHFVSSMNSYLGFFKHHKTYDIRHGLVKSISPQWWRVASFTSGATKITANKKYKPKYKRLCLE